MTSLHKPLHRIGMFDSGVGGLTVLRAIAQAFPHVPVVYFGDTARFPYGEKSPHTILQFSRENTHFLLSHNVDLIIVACHTASALALPSLHHEFPVPFLGVIDAGIQQALTATRTGRIAVLGTRGTINSGVYQQGLHTQQPEVHVVPIACPLFVPLVEEKLSTHEATRLIVRDYLQVAKQENVDTVLLGCTHYPVLAPLIQAEMGDDVIIVDSAKACAEYVHKHFSPAQSIDNIRLHQFFVSDNPNKFRSIGEQILGYPLHHVSDVAESALVQVR